MERAGIRELHVPARWRRAGALAVAVPPGAAREHRSCEGVAQDRCSGTAGRGPSAPLPRGPGTALAARTVAAGILAGAMLLLGALGAPPAQAQELLLSNFHSGDGGFFCAAGIAFGTDRDQCAQEFTTGSNAGGYTLSELKFVVNEAANPQSPRVSIYTEGAGGRPGSSLHVLSGTATADSTVTWTARANATLDPDTTYFVVWEDATTTETGNVAVQLAPDKNADVASAGWSLGSVYLKIGTGAWTRFGLGGSSANKALRVELKGQTVANSPATGVPSISGTRRVGESLTAAVTAIADEDGLDEVSYSYRWVRVDGLDEIEVGTDSATYMPVAADAGKRVKVVVSFTDDAGFAETRESAAIPIRAAMPPATCPAFSLPSGHTDVWSATLTVGEETTAVQEIHGYDVGGRGALSDTELDLGTDSYIITGLYLNESLGERLLVLGLSPDKLSGHKRANLYLHVCGESYAVAEASHDTRPGGRNFYRWGSTGLDWSSLVDEDLAVRLTLRGNTAATGAPTIWGRAQAGATLMARTSGIVDADGLAGAAFTYQWIRVDGTDEENIDGETASTYDLVAADVGKRVKLEVSFTDDRENAETRTSAAFPATGTVRAAPARVDPSALLSATLVAKAIGVTDATGCENGVTDAECSDTDVLSEDEFSFADTDYTVVAILELSAGTVGLQIRPTVPSAARASLSRRLSFRVTVGGTTTAQPFSHAAVVHESGATTFSWRLSAAPWSEGDTVSVVIRDAGTGDVTPPQLASDERPTVTVEGRRVLVKFDEALDHGNRPPATAFSVRADGAAITVTGYDRTASVNEYLALNLSPAVLSSHTVVRLSYTDPTARNDRNALQDGAGNDVATFANVAVRNGSTVSVPGAPTGLTATAMGATQIDLSWTAPADEGSSAIAGYRIEWSADGASGWTELEDDTGDTDTSYSDEGLSSKTTRHYRVSAVNSFGAGSPSDSASATTDDIEGPVPVSAEVLDSGTHLYLRFDEEVAGGVTLVSRFAVTADAIPVTIERVIRANSDLSLQLIIVKPAIRTGQVVRVTYTDPTSGDDTNAVQDEHGNDAPSFSLGPDTGDPFAVTNNSTVPFTVPSPPLDVEATAMGATRIDLSWTAPADDGGHEITGYRIEWSPDETSDWTVLKADTGNADTSYSDEGLSSKTTRHYRVSAINTLGASHASNIPSATTDDIEGPVPLSAEVDAFGDVLTITLDEVYADTGFDRDRITITADGAPVGFTGVLNSDLGTARLTLGVLNPDYSWWV